jgi:hypothetical protein
MKRLIFLSLIIAVLLSKSFLAPSHAQEIAKEEKPTFYRLTPGVYVNGWPRFTIHYPKDWVDVTPMEHEIFRAGAHGATGDLFAVVVAYPPNPPQPLDKVADVAMSLFKVFGKDMIVVTDKPSQLSNDTPAREVEIRGIMNGLPFNWLGLCVEHGDLWIEPSVSSQRGGIGEHLKAILYSLQYEPGNDEPVKLTPDVKEFFHSLSNAWISHDLAKLMSHYSDRYLNSGVKKGETERFLKQRIGFATSLEYRITDFIPTGDRAYLAGFSIFNGVRFPLIPTSIIKESGEWKWYGNQRDVAR